MAQEEFNQLKFDDKYVAWTIRCLPDKFIELCHRHLGALLDLSGDSLELLLSGHEEQKKRKSAFPSVGMFKKKDKSQGLFGLPLTDEGVCLMMPLIQFLNTKKNISKEGLFRKLGNKNRMTTLKDLLISHGPKVSLDPKVFSAHDVACVLKEFIRELPEPLLTERHLEAHRQILALGQHAKTPEEIDAFSSRKLSALQLLMLLLQSPVQKLTMHLVQLLQRVADSPESKMTSGTLGTIFAPIFFIERKVQSTDLHNQITTTTPAVSFMIDKAHDLFQPPRELVTDLTRFWKSMRESFLHSQNRESDQMQESLSDQTDVNCIDSELSSCDYGASNITAELVNLLEQMQFHSTRPKKFFDAPEFCAGLRKCSKSIGSSIKKRLQSMRQLRNKERDELKSRASSSSSSSSNSKTATSAWTRLFTQTSEARHSLQLLKPGHKRRYNLENRPTVVSSSSSNSLIKKKCQETATCSVTLNPTGILKHPKETGCEALPSSSSHPANAVSDFVENRNPKDLNSSLEDPAACDTENRENVGSASCNIDNKDSTHRTSHLKGKTDPENTCIVQPQLGHPLTGLSLPVAKCKVSGRHLDRPGCLQSETSNDCLPCVTTKKVTFAVTTSRHSNPVANTCQQPSRKAEKRLQSLRHLRNRERDMLKSRASSSSSSNSHFKTAASAWTRLFTQTSEARHSLQLPGHKRRHPLENCATAVSSNSSNSLIKKKCQEAATCSVTLTATGILKHPKETSCNALPSSSSHPAKVVSDFVENRNPKDFTSSLEDPAACDIENKENIGSATCNIGNKDSSHCTSHLKGKTDPENTCMVQPRLSRPLTGLSLAVAKCKVSGSHLDRPGGLQSETSNDCLPHVTTKKVNFEVTTSRHSNPVTNTCQQPSRKAETTPMTNATIRLNRDGFRETAL